MKTILIVDDEPDILASVKMVVEKMGYHAVTASDGIKALELLQRERVDLVLLDILMPGMSGREVLEKIRKNPKLKRQKVAMLTVVQPSEAGQKIIQKLRPLDYFIKPIDIVDFRLRLRKLL